jgi:TRAP-type C4-dicarboxylate transport system permease small subunit
VEITKQYDQEEAKLVHKLLSSIENVLTTSAIAAVAMMIFLTVVDTAGRYLLNLPIKGTYEITEQYLMVVTVYFALCHGYHNGSNIRVTFLVRCLSRRVRLVVDYIVQILSFLYGILLIVSSFVYALRGIRDTLFNVYGIPLGPAYMVVPVGLLIVTLWMLYEIGQVKKGKSGLLMEEEHIPDSVT